MKQYTVIIKNDATGQQVTKDFSSRAAYDKHIEEVLRQYFTLQEGIVHTLVVAKLPDLFDQE